MASITVTPTSTKKRVHSGGEVSTAAAYGRLRPLTIAYSRLHPLTATYNYLLVVQASPLALKKASIVDEAGQSCAVVTKTTSQQTLKDEFTEVTASFAKNLTSVDIIKDHVTPSLAKLFEEAKTTRSLRVFTSIRTELDEILRGPSAPTGMPFLCMEGLRSMAETTAVTLEDISTRIKLYQINHKRDEITDKYEALLDAEKKVYKDKMKKLIAERDHEISEFMEQAKALYPVSNWRVNWRVNWLAGASKLALTGYCVCLQGMKLSPSKPTVAATPRIRADVFVTEAGQKLVTVKKAASFFVKKVLEPMGGRAKISDVLDAVNDAFMKENPRGWYTTSIDNFCDPATKRFTIGGLRKLAKAERREAGRSAAFQPWYTTSGDDIYLVNAQASPANSESPASSESA